jgi:hypothetical protein
VRTPPSSTDVFGTSVNVALFRHKIGNLNDGFGREHTAKIMLRTGSEN